MNANISDTQIVTKTYSSIDRRLNRLLSQKAALENVMKLGDTSKRRARTRTLIQLGGLVSMSGLLDLVDIQEGDDLQLDIISQDKSAILLGMFLTFVDSHVSMSASEKDAFLKKGIRHMKLRAYKNIRG